MDSLAKQQHFQTKIIVYELPHKEQKISCDYYAHTSCTRVTHAQTCTDFPLCFPQKLIPVLRRHPLGLWALLCFSGRWKPPLFWGETPEPGLRVYRMALWRNFRIIFAAVLMAARLPHQRISFMGTVGHPPGRTSAISRHSDKTCAIDSCVSHLRIGLWLLSSQQYHILVL
ncbi:hypothetical protein PoB_002629200 [Plakobranchus ocellatus]|uniref:Uncharacterized protein n=1 Tax=Plakobranchus ocellatus TaxID=259542 RepID=A0AAV3ZYY3_9GAST|nr:hypothetical protein PoB_002629200 [Plakobranchus ocellatus]